MNKWIEQLEMPVPFEGHTPNEAMKRVYKAGAQAMLARVKEIIEESKALDWCACPWCTSMGSEHTAKHGRESLRQQILEELK